ncbi:AMP-binding protein [Mycobacterium saskatchewanense]|uniref:AMP-binding protein n=1 Tax=Mycobacterium saskatchewanense TaxID=220927 RepID=UPI0022B29541|nr:AMP-binding protein [Mycobacterium saskatchewanense]
MTIGEPCKTPAQRKRSPGSSNGTRSGPGDVAIRYGDQQWTWGDWASRIRRAAGALRLAGVERGQSVAFLDKNHPACLEILFAAASIGAVTTVVNWRVVGDEIVHVLQDSGARVLFVGAELHPAAEQAAARVPGLERVVVVGGDDDQYEALLAAAPPAATDAEVDETQTALVIYSSGTTGRPKGVLLSQRAGQSRRQPGAGISFAEGDANLVAMPLFHVGGIGYALFGIRAGVPTIMTREPDAAALLGAVRAGATHAFFVPPVIARFLDAGEAATAAMRGLRYIVYGAAPMPSPLLQQALATWPDMNFVQVYGQTELCGAVTALSNDDHRDPRGPACSCPPERPCWAPRFGSSTPRRAARCPSGNLARSAQQPEHERLPEPGRGDRRDDHRGRLGAHR